MLRDLFLLPDGSPFTAIGDITCRWAVNAGEDLCPGAACAAMVEATVFCPKAPVAQGQPLVYFRGDSPMGIFYCEKPRRTGANSFRITGYDAMIFFDREVGAFLDALSYPVTLEALLQGLCDHCGVPLSQGEPLSQGSLPVEKFPTAGVTGRQLLNWIGQAAGRYFYIDPLGQLCQGWYSGQPVALGGDTALLQLADGTLADRFFRPFAIRTAQPYRQDSLRYSDYVTAPVERVLIRAGDADVGTVWPDGSAEEANTLILQGNPLLIPRQDADPQAVARQLYTQLQGLAYTPFSCSLTPGGLILPGAFVSFTDAEGVRRTAPVMETQLRNGQCSITATGNPTLQSTTAFNHLTAGDLLGRVLTVERTAQGLQVANSDMTGAMAALELSLEGITTRVSAVETDAQEHATVTQLSQLEQKADSLALILSQLREDTDSKADGDTVDEIRQVFLFDADGLTISNSATGMGIGISQERIVFTGGVDPTTAITPNEMGTTNLRVGSRLDVGHFSLIPRTSGNLSLRFTAKG